MKYPSRPLSFRCFLILGLCVLFAAKGFPQAPPQPIQAEIRVAATGIVPGLHELWLRTGPEEEALPIRLNTRSFSRPVIYKGLPTAYLFRSKEAAEVLEPLEAPLMRLTLAEGSTLILFIPDAEKTSYRIYPIQAEVFPFGSFYFSNASSSTLLAQLGENTQPVRLNPNGQHIFQFEGKQAIKVSVAAKAPGEEPRLIRQTKFSITPNWREMVFFYDDPQTQRVKIRHIVDTRPSPVTTDAEEE